MSDVVTEGQAKTKWCPLVRVLQRDDIARHSKKGEDFSATRTGFAPTVAVNRNPFGESSEYRCIGSGCMAWHTVFSASPTDEPKGFCGAFGRPAGA